MSEAIQESIQEDPIVTNQMKSKMQDSAIKSFNAKYFDVEELIRVQDEIDGAETQGDIRKIVMEHHLRVMDQFQSRVVNDLAEKMADINS